MKIHLAEFGSARLDAPARQFAAVMDAQQGSHHICTKPADADIILFTQCHMLGRDWRLNQIAGHRLCKDNPGKVYVYDERDKPWLRFPGLYVSMPAGQFRRQWQVAAPYYVPKPRLMHGLPDDDSFLFTFVGSPTARCRERIYALSHPRSCIERVTGFVFYDPNSADFTARKQHYADVMDRSKFVLCPRGQGTSSIRLYETLAAGRVPVIIADAWVPPRGPRWETFTIRWPESRIRELPAYLESREADVPELIRAGGEEFCTWFAPDRLLAVRLDELEQIVRARQQLAFPGNGFRGRAWIEAALPQYEVRARRAFSPGKRRLAARLKPSA